MSRRVGVGVAAIVAVVAVVVAAALLLPDRTAPDPLPAPSPTTSSPSPTPSPEALQVLEPAAPAPVEPGAPPLADVLGPVVGDPRLGPRVGVAVTDLDTGAVAYDLQGARGQVPASTTKVLTAVAALAAVGPQTTFSTRALLTPDGGTVVLVGGGDPSLTADPQARGVPAPTRLPDLAEATAQALVAAGAGPVRVVVDDGLFTGPAVDPDWEDSYVRAGVAAPVSALAVDGGRVRPGLRARSADPAIAAGQVFAEQLGERAVTVDGEVVRGEVPRGSRELAALRSAPLAGLVEQFLASSDNDVAEVLGRHVAFVTGRPASESGATQAVTAVLAGLGVDLAGTDLRDASGLARGSRVPPRVLVDVLAVAADPDRPRLRAALTGLPVAGFTGTLDGRFDDGASAGGAGSVRAKTGTLTGVSSLAGVVTAASGTTYAFAVLADAVPAGGTTGAQAALDAVAAALAGCGCAPAAAPATTAP